MMFLELNDGRRINLTHMSTIEVDGTDVVYKPAKGSLDGIREHFETSEEAQQRFEKLQDELLD
jgi:hypothetical protein